MLVNIKYQKGWISYNILLIFGTKIAKIKKYGIKWELLLINLFQLLHIICFFKVEEAYIMETYHSTTANTPIIKHSFTLILHYCHLIYSQYAHQLPLDSTLTRKHGAN